MQRRRFLKLASTAPLLPAFLQVPGGGLSTGKTLIVLQLSGGNDGLNTVVPYAHDAYHRARPTLGISETTVLPVDKSLGLGFHPAFAPLRGLLDVGEMSVVNSVGYPNPDRSHFRSMDIWQTGSGSGDYCQTGWLGRYLDHHCAGKPRHHALDLDEGVSLALRGERRSGFAFGDTRQLNRTAKNRFHHAAVERAATGDHAELQFLYKTLADTQQSAAYLSEKSRQHAARAAYPKGKFGRDLRQIAELMTAGTDTRVYYAALGGFDTHARQAGRQQRLLKEYAEGTAALIEDLKRHRLFDETLILTFSEFGRRVAQNAGGGTDHGTANNVFLMSGQLRRAGFYNAAPDLEHLNEGDLVHRVDFRSVYTDALGWLGVDAATVLGGRFAGVGVV